MIVKLWTRWVQKAIYASWNLLVLGVIRGTENERFVVGLRNQQMDLSQLVLRLSLSLYIHMYGCCYCQSDGYYKD
jgi:hypothetical protein